MDHPARWLERQGAQRDVVAWAEAHASWPELWASCPRGDWMLSIALRRGADAARVVASARAVATLAFDHVEDEERIELELALATPSDERAQAIELRAEASVDPAHQAALLAVAIAVRGHAEDAAMVPLQLVQAAAMDSAECGMSAAVSYVQRRSAELVREVIASPP